MNFSNIINIAININIQIINTAILAINETIIYPISTGINITKKNNSFFDRKFYFLVNLEQLHVDFDSPGNDIQILNNITTRRKCVAICLNTSKCVAVAYRLADGVCFLKDCVMRLTVRVGTDVVHLATGR